MMRRMFAPCLVVALALFVLGPASGLAASGSQTYQLHLELPNVSQASNGDKISVTGEGEFGIHPKSATANGEFVHTDSSGTVLATGTWTATDLIEFQPYGCGVVHNFPTPGVTTPLPPNVCGGAVKMNVTLTPHGTTLAIPGILTVFCIIGPNPPNSHDDPTGEGIHLVVPGIANFNKIVSGMNMYIRQS
ncbi:MAG: hypothetical protein E6G08_12070 [Actinobacteria bacterium]|nr:MAG: hypothetical protein E6G08_12070 [Actinomycetota bacterium]